MNKRIVHLGIACVILISFTSCGKEESQEDTISSVNVNSIPIADAGEDQNVYTTTTVSLDGSNSTDEETAVIAYNWTIVSKPKDSNITLSDPEMPLINFRADADGEYVFSLIVNDYYVNSEADSVTIIANTYISETVSKSGISYKTLLSSHTGRIWLDRNLGASQVCTELNDTACYGDYYQWGREADGHEKYNSMTTTILAADVSGSGTSYIITSAEPYDWTTTDVDGTLRNFAWSKTDETSICPVGFRVPTISELTRETIEQGLKSTIDIFNSFLKLPPAGLRNYYTGSLGIEGTYAYYWLSDTYIQSGSNLRGGAASYYNPGIDGVMRYELTSNGRSIRCIKE